MSSQLNDFQAKLKVQGKPVAFLLDTGSLSNLLPEKYLDLSSLSLGPPKVLQMWKESSEKSLGTVKRSVTNPKIKSKNFVIFEVVRGDHKPVLGVKDVLKMNLISVNIDNFKRVLNVRSAESRQTLEMMADLISRHPEGCSLTL